MNILQLALIARALSRHRLIVGIFAVQIVVTVAVVANIGFLFMQQLDALAVPSGLDEPGLAIIETEFVGEGLGRIPSAVQSDLQALRQVPGIMAVSILSAVPLGQAGWSIGIANRPGSQEGTPGFIEADVAVFAAGPGAVAALGLRLEAGNDFGQDAYVPLASDDYFSGLYKAAEVIVSRQTAELLFPGQSPLGKVLYADGSHPLQIVGVVEHLARPVLGQGRDGGATILLPLVPDGARVTYALRTRPDRISEVLAAGEQVLKSNERSRMLRRSTSYAELRRGYFRRDMTMATLFIGAGVALLLVTGIGIYGLSSFWVRQRYTQIGIRRALGARRRDVVSHFLLENLMICTAAGVLGVASGALLNRVLALFNEVPVIQWPYLVVGAVLVAMIGQLATWLPTRRAAKDAPVASLRGGESRV
ncbi:MAG: ABC transporter permease [Stenotrophomonas sp.]